MFRKSTRLFVEALEDRCVPSATTLDGPRELSVMSRNLYVGADLAPAIFATVTNGVIPVSVWQSVQNNNFPERAEALADEILETQPHLVGLQEVSLFRTGPRDLNAPALDVRYDYLNMLLGELQERGLHYAAVAVSVGADVEHKGVTDLGEQDVRLTDREVLLARTDLPASEFQLANVQAGNFTTNLTLPNVLIRRGWVSADVGMNGKTARVISTHLDADSPAVQVAQGNELLAGPANTSLAVVLIGDFNSNADSGPAFQTATYDNLIAAGFEDAWSQTHPGDAGLTWGHATNLSNPDSSTFTARIDLVLFRGDVAALQSDVLGEEPADKTPSNLWPSDHAGVVARLQLHAPPTVDTIQMNDGAAQRSMVNSITVTFSEAVTLGAGAFEVIRHGGGAVTTHVATSLVGGKAVAILTFSGAGITAGSLADGNYRLVIHAGQVQDGHGNRLDGDKDGNAGEDARTNFFRLFGDSDGDADVDLHDLARFIHAFGSNTGDADFVRYFDFNGDGRIFAVDLAQFLRRLGRRV